LGINVTYLEFIDDIVVSLFKIDISSLLGSFIKKQDTIFSMLYFQLIEYNKEKDGRIFDYYRCYWHNFF